MYGFIDHDALDHERAEDILAVLEKHTSPEGAQAILEVLHTVHPKRKRDNSSRHPTDHLYEEVGVAKEKLKKEE